MNVPFRTTALAVALTLPSLLLAQEVVEVVTVTATPQPAADLPASFQVIDRDAIDSRQSWSALELLRDLPGVDVGRTGGPGSATSIFTRGTNSTQTLVLIDGVQVNNPNFSGYDLAHLTTDAVEQIEVVKGPFSAIWGPDAVGGVVNVITRAPDSGFHADLAAELGEKRSRRASLDLSGGRDDLGWAGGAWGRDGEGAFDGFAGIARDTWFSRGADLRLEWRPSESMSLRPRARMVDSALEIPFSGGFGTSARADRRQSDDERVLSVPFRHQVSETFGWGLAISSVATSVDFSDPDGDFGFKSSDVDTRQRTARLDADWEVGDHTLSAGADHRQREVDNFDSYGTNLTADGKDQTGVWIQDLIRLGDRWTIQVGARWDDHEQYGSVTSPRLGVSTAVGGGRLHGAWGESFRAPSVGELFFPFFGNPALVPEEGRSWEVGYQRPFEAPGLGRGRVALTVFDTEIENLIQYNFSTFALDNLGAATTGGVELSAEIAPCSAFDVNLAVTRLDTEDVATGLTLLRRPESSVSARLRLRPRDGWLASLDATWVDERDDIDIDFSRATNPEFLRVDLAVTASFGRTSPFVRLENLTDESYQDALGYPAPGRRINAGVRVDF